jgi:hypothetical protein
MDKRLRFMTGLIAPLKVEPGSEVRLSRDHDPGYTGGVARPQAATPLADGVVRVHEELLAAERMPADAATGSGPAATGRSTTGSAAWPATGSVSSRSS